MLSILCTLLGLLVVATATALLLGPAAGLLAAGAELLWLGYQLDEAP